MVTSSPVMVGLAFFSSLVNGGGMAAHTHATIIKKAKARVRKT